MPVRNICPTRESRFRASGSDDSAGFCYGGRSEAPGALLFKDRRTAPARGEVFMATTNSSADQVRVRSTRKIPVRKITSDDLRFALKAGLEDFKDMRGDIFFAGLIYTFIGVAAVVMTTSRPLIPFFFPVVAGVGLLGPVAAVGFYELAKLREDGKQDL